MTFSFYWCFYLYIDAAFSKAYKQMTWVLQAILLPLCRNLGSLKSFFLVIKIWIAILVFYFAVFGLQQLMHLLHLLNVSFLPMMWTMGFYFSLCCYILIGMSTYWIMYLSLLLKNFQLAESIFISSPKVEFANGNDYLCMIMQSLVLCISLDNQGTIKCKSCNRYFHYQDTVSLSSNLWSDCI